MFSVSFADDAVPPAKRESLAPSAPAKVVRYAAIMVQRYDQNNDGILQREEWEAMPGNPQAIDIDGDQQITRSELVWYFVQYGQSRTIHRTIAVNLSDPYKFDPANLKFLKPVWQRTTPTAPGTEIQKKEEDLTADLLKSSEQPIDDDAYQKMLEDRQIPSARPYHVLPEKLRGVPAWFILRDRDGDGQISPTEFAPMLSPAAMNLFKTLDKNGDGLIVPDEVRNPQSR